MAEPRSTLEAIFRTALSAVDAEQAVVRALSRGAIPADVELVVLAAGKAAVPMMRALEAHAGPRIRASLVVTKRGFGGAVEAPVLEAGHPVPDATSERAGRAALALAAGAERGSVFVVLLSGGASALLATPAPGLALTDLAGMTDVLLASGADIHEVNTLRKHTSAVAGGQLARAAASSGRVALLALSDVPGDDPSVIGSGPCTADPTTYADALEIVARRGLREKLPRRVVDHLVAGAAGDRPETPNYLGSVDTTLVARNADAREAALAAARGRDMLATDLGEIIAGEARTVADELVQRALGARCADDLVLVAGGESTVTLGAVHGQGGRNQELALAAARRLDGVAGVTLLAAGTDGNDGPTDAAGAIVDGGTCVRARAAGCDVDAALEAHDAYPLFAGEGGLLRTGPSRTNVMDLVLMHVEGAVRG